MKMEEVSITRDNAVSYVRCLAMLMIVLCHIFQYCDLELAWWLNVGVQIFLVVSGFLYGQKDIGDSVEWFIRQAKKILVPYWIYCLFFICVCMMKDNISFMSIIRLLTCSGVVAGVQHVWFIPYILFCYIITPFLLKIKKRYEERPLYITIIVFILLMILISVEGTLLNSFFRPPEVVCYVSGYLIAILMQKTEKRTMYILTAVSIAVASVLNGIRIYLKYFETFPESEWFITFFSYFEKYAHSILGIALFLFLYMVFKGCKESVISRFSDKYSYYIYLVHHAFILGPFSLMAISSNGLLSCTIVVFLILVCARGLWFMTNEVNKLLVWKAT